MGINIPIYSLDSRTYTINTKLDAEADLAKRRRRHVRVLRYGVYVDGAVRMCHSFGIYDPNGEVEHSAMHTDRNCKADVSYANVSSVQMTSRYDQQVTQHTIQEANVRGECFEHLRSLHHNCLECRNIAKVSLLQDNEDHFPPRVESVRSPVITVESDITPRIKPAALASWKTIIAPSRLSIILRFLSTNVSQNQIGGMERTWCYAQS